MHYLPVRGAHCQLGCPDVWQKRHALTPIIPEGAWRVAQLACAPAPVLARHAAVLEPSRPPPAYGPPLSPIRPAPPQTIPPSGSICSNFSSKITRTTASSCTAIASRPVEDISSVPASRVEQWLPLFLRPSRQ